MELLPAPAWSDVIDYLRFLGTELFVAATDLLDDAIDRHGIGAINDAVADVCRSLMQRVTFDTGTVDIHRVVDQVARRTVETSGDERPGALDRQRSLIVYLGNERLPCAADGDIASWSAEELLRNSIACMIGLLGVVSNDQQASIADVVATIEPPRPVGGPEGTFGLASRGSGGAEPFAGVVPRGYTANITFAGEQRCTLWAILAHVALLRDVAVPVSSRTTPCSEDTFIPR